jgi:hypothetical protein
MLPTLDVVRLPAVFFVCIANMSFVVERVLRLSVQCCVDGHCANTCSDLEHALRVASAVAVAACTVRTPRDFRTLSANKIARNSLAICAYTCGGE